MRTRPSSTPRTVLAMLPAVLVGAGLSVIVLWMFRGWNPLGDLHISNNEVGNYLQTVGTVYGVLLAFVLAAVWQQFNEARTFVEIEANEVVDLHRIAGGLPEAERMVLQRELAEYVDAVINEEWPAMACGDEKVIEQVGARLDRIWGSLHVFEPCSECHKALHAEALGCFNDLSDARTNRLAAARTRLPTGMRILLWIGACIVVSSMLLLAVDRFLTHAIITGALAGAVSHVLYLIFDLDDAFDGNWRVLPTPFERMARRMTRP
jgi:hypothetical protein